MTAVHPCDVPLNTMLRSYKDGPGYADCYVTEVQGAITQVIFIEAFYTSPLFKVERTILKYLASIPMLTQSSLRQATPPSSQLGASSGSRPQNCFLQTSRGAQGHGSWQHQAQDQ